LPPTVGQGANIHRESPSLDDLANRIRDAHTGVTAAFSNAIDRAIDAGRTLIIAKKLIVHGQWCKFLKGCNIGDRRAERYMRLACLVAANPTCKSDLAELSIEQAIKLLSPPKPSKDTPTSVNRRSTASSIARSLQVRTSSLPGSTRRRMNGREPLTPLGSTQCWRRCRRDGGRCSKALSLSVIRR
jgi:hypothetical protein